MSQGRRRVIRSACRGISFPHCLRSVLIVYQILPAIGEESLNKERSIFYRIINKRDSYCGCLFVHIDYYSYAGYALLSRSSNGSASVKMLMAQGYMALREQNISSRQASVKPSGPVTAKLRLMV